MKRKTKIIYGIVMSAVTVIGSVILFFVGCRYGTFRIAKDMLAEDISRLQREVSATKQEKETVKDEIERLNESMSDQSFLSDEIMRNRDSYKQLTESIENNERASEELDGRISSEKEEIAALEKITAGREGAVSKLSPLLVYSCPKDFEEGRYKVSGAGTLLVYSPSNHLRISENLAVLDDESFTFDLEENERIKIDTEMEICPIKQ